MVKLKINDASYDLPEKWDEVKYSSFKKIQEYLKDKEPVDIKSYVLISLLCDVELDIVKQIPLPNIREILEIIKFFYDEIPKYNNERQDFEIGNTKFHVKNFNSDVSFAEWMDFKETDDLLIQIAVMAKKYNIVKKFNTFKVFKKKIPNIFKKRIDVKDLETYDYDLTDRIKYFGKNLTIREVLEIKNFFLANVNESQQLFLTYSMVKENLIPQMESIDNFIKSGGGTIYFKILAIFHIWRIKRLWKNVCSIFSHSTRI